jgi:hypothetical protein
MERHDTDSQPMAGVCVIRPAFVRDVCRAVLVNIVQNLEKTVLRFIIPPQACEEHIALDGNDLRALQVSFKYCGSRMAQVLAFHGCYSKET